MQLVMRVSAKRFLSRHEEVSSSSWTDCCLDSYLVNCDHCCAGHSFATRNENTVLAMEYVDFTKLSLEDGNDNTSQIAVG